MIGVGVFVIAAKLKSPDPVAKLHTVEQSHFGEICEVSVDGGLVKAFGGELGDQIGVAQGRGGLDEAL